MAELFCNNLFAAHLLRVAKLVKSSCICVRMLHNITYCLVQTRLFTALYFLVFLFDR